MKAMTGVQIKEFTNDLDRIAVAIGALRQNGKLGNGKVLTQEEKSDLLIGQIKILRASAAFSPESIQINLNQIKEQVLALKKATGNIDRTLSQIKSVKEVISFSSLAVAIAEDVITNDIVGVTDSFDNLLTAIARMES